MASIAEMLISGTQQGIAQTGENISRGAQLAQSIQQMQNQKAQLEQQKQELQMQKVNSVVDTFKVAAGAKDPKTKNFLLKNVIPGKIKALGMEEFFSPATLEFVQQSDEALQKVLGLQLELEDQVNKRIITGAEAYKQAQAILSNPEEIALLDTDRLFEAQKFAASEGGKEARTQFMAQAGLGKQIQAQQAAGQVEASKQVAKEFADYKAAGGKATLDKNLKKLEDAARKLESGEVEVGSVSAAIPGLRSDTVQDVINPRLAAVRDDVRGAIQGTLRQVLGAQFTAQEGEAIFNRAFNPRLSAAENARRIRQEIEGLRRTIQNKEQEFKARGFGGEEGKPTTPKEKSGAKAQNLSSEGQAKLIEALAKKLNISLAEARKRLGL